MCFSNATGVRNACDRKIIFSVLCLSYLTRKYNLQTAAFTALYSAKIWEIVN